MNIWQRFKKWALAPDTTTQAKTVEESVYDTMVGEPVISFLDSLKREPKRYKLDILTLEEYRKLNKVYSWMSTRDCTFYQLTDKKRGDVYTAFGMSGSPLYRVDGLPFSLNHWELRAVWSAFVQLRTVARERKRRIEDARWERRRAAEQKAELILREEYAKKFQQEGV